MRLAILTEVALPDLTADDQLVLPALAARGVEAVAAAWDDPGVDWRRFGAVLVRSPWNYYRRPAEFLAFLDRIDAIGLPVMNPTAVLRWNADKRYLPELAARGVPIIPTQILSSAEVAGLTNLPWPECVLKPAISGNAMHTARYRADRWTPPALPEGRWLLQPYLAEIESRGEVSLIYLGGVFSHAVRKIPAPGDFRVQADFGGRYVAIEPTPEVVEAADRAIAAAPGGLTYARVDGVETEAGFLLMELELLEPNLFLGYGAEAPARLAEAVARG